MTPYQNLSGRSGVSEFTIGPDFIKIRFISKSDVYVYDASKPGANHVGNMKKLAAEGRGLATYVSKNIRKRYAQIEKLA